MKLLPLMLLFFALECSILIFDISRNVSQAPSFTDSQTQNYSSYSSNTSGMYTPVDTLGLNDSGYSTSFMNTNSNDFWGGFDFSKPLFSNKWMLFTLGFSVILWGASFFFNRGDISIRSIIAILLYGLGGIPVLHLWYQVTREVGNYACTASQSVCWPSHMIGILIVSPIYLIWWATVLEWQTGSATT